MSGFKHNVGLFLTTTLGKVVWVIAYIAAIFLAVFIVKAVIVGAFGGPFWLYLVFCGLSGVPVGYFFLTLPMRWLADAKEYLATKQAVEL